MIRLLPQPDPPFLDERTIVVVETCEMRTNLKPVSSSSHLRSHFIWALVPVSSLNVKVGLKKSLDPVQAMLAVKVNPKFDSPRGPPRPPLIPEGVGTHRPASETANDAAYRLGWLITERTAAWILF
jgi:hypothetical protein